MRRPTRTIAALATAAILALAPAAALAQGLSGQTPAQAGGPELPPLPPPDPAPKPTPAPKPQPRATPSPEPAPEPPPEPAAEPGPSPEELAAERERLEAAEAARIKREKEKQERIAAAKAAAEKRSKAIAAESAKFGGVVVVGANAVRSAADAVAATTAPAPAGPASVASREGADVIDTRIAAFAAMLLLAIGLFAVSSGRHPAERGRRRPQLAAGNRPLSAHAGPARRTTVSRRSVVGATERFLAEHIGEVTVVALAVTAILVTIYLMLNPGFFFQ